MHISLVQQIVPAIQGIIRTPQLPVVPLAILLAMNVQMEGQLLVVLAGLMLC